MRFGHPFPLLCHEAGLPLPVAEYALTAARKFRWDWAWPDHGVVLEVQGGLYRKGGHSTGLGITRDMTKANVAAALGFRTLFLTPATLYRSETLELLQWVLTPSGPDVPDDLLVGMPPQLTGSPRRRPTRTKDGRTSRRRPRP